MNCFRFNNLVYIPITKHASSSYTELFGNRLKWKPEQTENIVWDQDHVFAHIIDPFTRHLKGIAECLIKYEITDIIDDPRFVKLLSTAVFDLHSYPLAITFGENAYKIDWLMLDALQCTGGYLTCKLLNSYGIDISESDIPVFNTSDSFDRQVVEQVKQARDANDLAGTLTYFYDQDVVLYDRVNRNTQFAELNNWTWAKCSWLTNYNKVT